MSTIFINVYYSTLSIYYSLLWFIIFLYTFLKITGYFSWKQNKTVIWKPSRHHRKQKVNTNSFRRPWTGYLIVLMNVRYILCNPIQYVFQIMHSLWKIQPTSVNINIAVWISLSSSNCPLYLCSYNIPFSPYTSSYGLFSSRTILHLTQLWNGSLHIVTDITYIISKKAQDTCFLCLVPLSSYFCLVSILHCIIIYESENTQSTGYNVSVDHLLWLMDHEWIIKCHLHIQNICNEKYKSGFI